jgi:hypothetical protein
MKMESLLALLLVAGAGVAAFVMLRPKSVDYQTAPMNPQITDEQAKWGALQNIFGTLGLAGAYVGGQALGGGSGGGGGGSGFDPGNYDEAYGKDYAAFWNANDI